jgi:NAD(P)-dependent dehydrogenase (short-subunit alcohol dehydrogenase family)
MSLDSEIHRGYAIVTGGGSGLGREICKVLAADGYRVAIVGIHRDGLEQTKRIIERADAPPNDSHVAKLANEDRREVPTAQVEICDVTDVEAWQALRGRLQSEWPRLDILVNNAGMFSSGFVGQQDLVEIDRVLRLNLYGAIYGCETMVPWLIECAKVEKLASSHVVNVSSIYAYLCPPGMSAYNISKAGLVGLSETLRGEMAPHGIGVTVVCPGPMPTRFIESGHFASDAFRRLTQKVVRDSTLRPDSVAKAIRNAILDNELYCMMGAEERWFWRAKRWLPTTLLRRVARRVRQDLKQQLR